MAGLQAWPQGTPRGTRFSPCHSTTRASCRKWLLWILTAKILWLLPSPVSVQWLSLQGAAFLVSCGQAAYSLLRELVELGDFQDTSCFLPLQEPQ